jgi:mono/diheme cytochrome c family protein
MKTLKTLAIIGLLAILVGIASTVYFFGGYYSVAGTAEEPAIVKWALVKVRQASVAQHAKDKPPTTLDDPATVQAGARAFSERGCVNCHGGPGVNWAKFSRSSPTRSRPSSCSG